MRTPVLTHWAVILGCCSAWHLAGAADSSRRQTPLNLARPSAGAQLAVANGQTDASALLRDDDPLGYPLEAGDTSMTLTLPQIEVLKRFNFLNLTAAGKVTVSVSTAKAAGAGATWREVESKSFSGTDVVSLDFGSVEARQVKLDFHLDHPGRIDTFGLFGLRTLSSRPGSYAAAKGSEQKALMYNYAVSSPDAGVVMVSPGEDIKSAQALADGDVGTAFAFQATDPEPMAVVDLGTTRKLNRVSVSFKAGPGQIDVYLVEDPALQKGGSAKTIQDVIKTSFPAGHDPILTSETGKQSGLNRVNGAVNGQSGRYLVLNFHPAGGAEGSSVEAKDFKDVDFKDAGVGSAPAGTGSAPFEVSELTAFGDTPPGALISNFPPNLPGVSISVPPTAPGQPPAPPIFPPSGGSNTVSP